MSRVLHPFCLWSVTVDQHVSRKNKWKWNKPQQKKKTNPTTTPFPFSPAAKKNWPPHHWKQNKTPGNIIKLLADRHIHISGGCGWCRMCFTACAWKHQWAGWVSIDRIIYLWARVTLPFQHHSWSHRMGIAVKQKELTNSKNGRTKYQVLKP